MKKLDYLEIAPSAIKRIKAGALLTVKSGDELNTMTIGWAAFGFVWQKPIMMVAVRDSRHTFKIIEKAADFTVSIPSKDMKETITFCGTKSGRDVNKYEACGLEVIDAQEVVSPIIDTPGIHYECRIAFKAPMDPEYLLENYDNKLYPEKDYHTLYFGEIIRCYEIE